MTGLISLLLMAAPPPPGGKDRSSPARPTEPVASWFSDVDYPVEALMRGIQGNSQVRLRIDETGRPTKCAIRRSAGDAALDRAACAIFSTRGRYRPARDRAGRAVPGTIVQRVRWVLPAEPEPWMPFVAMRWVNVLHATAAGALDCAVGTIGATVPVALDQCWLFTNSDFPAGMRAMGSEVTATVIFTSVPVGQSLPQVAPADHGERRYESAASMSVAPDGRVADCRTVRHYFVARMPGFATPPDICASFTRASPRPPFAPSPGTSEVRLVRVNMAVYLRLGPRPAP